MTLAQTTIDAQTAKLADTAAKLAAESNAIDRKTRYVQDSHSVVKMINSLLLYFYLFLFIVIHALFLDQYLRGVERSELWDSVWITFFFLYPYLIYFVESYIYFGITYVASFIYNQVYVYGFDRLATGTDFYKPPVVQ